MAVFFLFLRNVLLPIEILKIKILEHSDPPSQHFSVHKAFSHSFFCRGKVMLCHPAEWHTDLRSLKFVGSNSRLGAAIKTRHPFPSAIKIKIAYTNCRASGMLEYPGDVVNATFVLEPNLEATFSCISFMAANKVWMASQILFGVGSPPLSCSRNPVACR